MPIVTFDVPEELLKDFDKKRGLISRSAALRRGVEAIVKGEVKLE